MVHDEDNQEVVTRKCRRPCGVMLVVEHCKLVTEPRAGGLSVVVTGCLRVLLW